LYPTGGFLQLYCYKQLPDVVLGKAIAVRGFVIAVLDFVITLLDFVIVVLDFVVAVLGNVIAYFHQKLRHIMQIHTPNHLNM
jgi:hypothetical protein